ncbi:hypothetical protein BHS05_32410 [Myxococcus xanthus]|nr:hypothetical protein BHS05_32410 [Myxococcus xanthus]
MHGRPHHFLRWLRLFLSCLTLASSGAMALPRAQTVAVCCMVDAEAVRPPLSELARSVHQAVSEPARRFTAAFQAPDARASEDTPGPVLRLYLLHRVLLH